MTIFLQHNADYLEFIFGLSLASAAALCFSLFGRDRRLPWVWLGLFSFTQAVVEWLALSADDAVDLPAFRLLRPCLLIVSCAFFGEFSRRGWTTLRGRGPGRWVHFPLLVLLGVMGWLGGDVLDLATTRLLIPLEAVVAGIVFWDAAQRDWKGNGRWLVLLAVSCGGNALNLLTLRAPDALLHGPAPSAGVVSLLGAVFTGVGVVGLTAYWMNVWSHRRDPRFVRSRRRVSVGIAAALISVLVLGWVATDRLGRNENAEGRDELLVLTASVAAGLPLKRVEALAQAQTVPDSADYDLTCLQLQRVRETDADCRHVYLMGWRDGQVVFLADDAPASSPDHATFGQPYPEASPDVQGLFYGGGPAVRGPAKNHWGMGLTGLAPVAGPEAGEVEAVLGVDMDSSFALAHVKEARQLGISIAAVVFMLVISIFLGIQRFADVAAQVNDSDRRYRTLVESSPNAIVQMDEEGRVVSINRYGLEMMGLTEAETVGWPFVDLFCGAAQLAARAALAEVLAGGLPHFEATCPGSNGTPISWQIMLRPVVDEVSEVRRLVAICVDITERKRAEETLSAANQRLAAVNEIASALASTLDQQSVMRIVLREVQRVVPCEGMNLIMCEPGGQRGRVASAQGSGAGDLVLGPEEYADLSDLELDDVLRRGREVYRPDLRLLTSPVFRRLVESGLLSSVSVPIVSDHLVLGCLNVGRSRVDAFSEAERELLRSLTSHIGAALNNARAYEQLRTARAAQVDVLQRLTAVNQIAQALASTLDQASVMRIVLQEVRGVVPFDRASLVMCDATGERGRFVAVTGDPELAALLPVGLEADLKDLGLDHVIAESGESYKPDMRLQPSSLLQKLAAGGILSSVSVPVISDHLMLGCLNVGRRDLDAFSQEERELLLSLTPHIGAALNNARAYEQLRGARADLQKAQEQMLTVERLRSIGEVAGGVAHDFNNLLGVILNRTQVLLEKLDDPATLESLRLIERATRDGRDTVKRIQSFVSKHSDEANVVVNLDDLVSEALQMTAYRWKNEAEREGATITTEALLGAAPLVRVNPAEIREVLVNLIINACEAMPQGGHITVRTDSEEGVGRFAVTDTGVGMDEATREHIFDLFFTTKGASNTGLGLAISQGVIQRHGGRIAVVSAPGKGTTFTVSLPLTTDKTEEETDLTSTPPTSTLQVLVVDDDPMVREALQMALDAIGYPAVGAPNGQEAVELVKEQPFDVVVTDLGMPGMSGWKVAEEVKRLSPRTQVMILTGWGETIEPTRFVDETLSKPLELSVLREVMSRAEARKAA